MSLVNDLSSFAATLVRLGRGMYPAITAEHRAAPKPRREDLKKLGGKVQVPYLVDPNTHTRLYESDDIIDYLNERYAKGHHAGWSLPIPSLLDDIDSAAASVVRLGRGTRCRAQHARADLKPLTLYNMEGSPYCRKVREALSELDLEYIVRNLPKGSPKRADLKAHGGKMQVPYLVDPNTTREMYESDEIVAYLDAEYGPARRTAARRTPSN